MSNDHSLECLLREGLICLDIYPDAERIDKALSFIDLIARWNRVYNLTALKSPEEFVRLHLLDSLTVLPHLHGERILDVGTGAGLPGIPLALWASERNFVLLDTNSKKTRFVQQAVIELGLNNVRIVHERVENYQDQEDGFSTVISRAFASLQAMLHDCRHLLAPDGVMLAMKGRYPDDELANLASGSFMITPLHVPGVDAERHLVRFHPADQINN